MQRRQLIAFAGAGLAASLVPAARAQKQLTPVKVTLDFRISGQVAPFLLALAKGYYRDEGPARQRRRARRHGRRHLLSRLRRVAVPAHQARGAERAFVCQRGAQPVWQCGAGLHRLHQGAAGVGGGLLARLQPRSGRDACQPGRGHGVRQAARGPTLDAHARYLRQVIALSAHGCSRGNRPFGAVLVGADHQVLAEAWCNTSETGDCTGHAETNAVRVASPVHGRDVLAAATMYSSGEPCVMCAGAIFWDGIRRVVFGIDAVSLRVFRGEVTEQRDAELSCRDVFAESPYPIECIGPALLDEAAAPHVGFWKS